jgi:hypothetical protein
VCCMRSRRTKTRRRPIEASPSRRPPRNDLRLGPGKPLRVPG